MIFLILPILAISYWALRRWQCEYYKGDVLIDKRSYLNRNIFWYMPRKIYRPGKITGKEYDIFVLTKVDRLRKINNYILSNMSDDPIITRE